MIDFYWMLLLKVLAVKLLIMIVEIHSVLMLHLKGLFRDLVFGGSRLLENDYTNKSVD